MYALLVRERNAQSDATHVRMPTTARTAAREPREPSLPPRPREIIVGVLMTGPATSAVGVSLVDELERRISRLYPSVRWRVELRRDPIIRVPEDAGGLIAYGRRRLLQEGWTLALVLTDRMFPLDGRAIVSRTHGVGILSISTESGRPRGDQVIERMASLVAGLIGERDSTPEDPAPRPAATRRRLHDLSAPRRQPSPLFALGALRAHARLSVRMVLANRPWRLASTSTADSSPPWRSSRSRS